MHYTQVSSVTIKVLGYRFARFKGPYKDGYTFYFFYTVTEVYRFYKLAFGGEKGETDGRSPVSLSVP